MVVLGVVCLGVPRSCCHHSPHRCPNALSSGRSESAAVAWPAPPTAGGRSGAEVFGTRAEAACLSAESAAAVVAEGLLAAGMRHWRHWQVLRSTVVANLNRRDGAPTYRLS